MSRSWHSLQAGSPLKHASKPSLAFDVTSHSRLKVIHHRVACIDGFEFKFAKLREFVQYVCICDEAILQSIRAEVLALKLSQLALIACVKVGLNSVLVLGDLRGCSGIFDFSQFSTKKEKEPASLEVAYRRISP